MHVRYGVVILTGAGLILMRVGNLQADRQHSRSACGHPGDRRHGLPKGVSDAQTNTRPTHNLPLLPIVEFGWRPQLYSRLQLPPL
jgi:hypothetical protein